MERITTNFRGYRALVLQSDGENTASLSRILGKLGLQVTAQDPRELRPETLPEYNLIFLDTDDESDGLEALLNTQGTPIIAIIGNEAPSRLANVVRYRCASHILKPIRGTGVYTAVLLAVNEHSNRQRNERNREGLRVRLAGRREVTKAVIQLMRLCGIDEDAAYERLRADAMTRRVPIDQVAREYLCHDESGRTSRKA